MDKLQDAESIMLMYSKGQLDFEAMAARLRESAEDQSTKQ